MSERQFIVVFDDDQGFCLPMVWDNDCDGAICCYQSKTPVALFSSRKDARKAIRISAFFARLLKSQGKPANEDFIGTCRKFIRIVPCQRRKP